MEKAAEKSCGLYIVGCVGIGRNLIIEMAKNVQSGYTLAFTEKGEDSWDMSEREVALFKKSEDLVKKASEVKNWILLGALGERTTELPDLAQKLREKEVWLEVFAIMPFRFEGEGAKARAQASLQILEDNANAITVFESEEILRSMPKKASFAQIYETLLEHIRVRVLEIIMQKIQVSEEKDS